MLARFAPTITTGMLVLSACAPSSIFDAIAKHPEAFPPPYNSIAPISGGSRGGTMGTVQDGVFVADASKCFEVTATVKESGVAVTANYGRKSKSTAELNLLQGSISKALGELGIDANVAFGKSTKLKTGTISNELVYVVPAPFGECTFDNPAKIYDVVRQQVRASNLRFSSDLQVTTDAGVEVPINELLDVGAESSWTFTNERQITGKEVVVAVKLERVKATITRETKTSSSTPLVGIDLVKTLNFTNPRLRDIQLTFQGSSMAEPGKPKLKILPNSAVPFIGVESAALARNLCTMGQEAELGVGDICYFIPPPGNILISLGWTKGVDPTSGADTIELSIFTYETTDPDK